MDKTEWAVVCSKCDSTNIEYNYRKTTINSKNNKIRTAVDCLDCGYETFEEN